MTEETAQQTTAEQATEEIQDAQGWRPNKGDRIVGTVIDITATDMGYGVYPIVTLKTANGEVALHAFHTVLRRELARRRPKIGDELDVTYLGKTAGGGIGGRGYDNYRVRSDKDMQGYDWERELPEEMREPTTATAEVPIEPAALPDEPAGSDVPDSDDDVPF